MKSEVEDQMQQINFDNHTNPSSYFEVVRLEDLLSLKLDHNQHENHIVKFFVILFITEGEGVHEIDFKSHSYQKGTVLLIRKNQVHKFFKNPAAKGFLLVFTEDFIISHLNVPEYLKALQLFNEFLSDPQIELSNEHSAHDLMLEAITQMKIESENGDEYAEGITRSFLHIVITRLFRLKSAAGGLSNKRQHLEQFIAFQNMIEKECLQTRKVTDYASKLGISTKTLNKISQIVLNMSAKSFIDEIAILQIKRLLFNSSLSIKEMAHISGFDDPANFSKYFKKYVSVSPELFRRSLLK